MTLKEKADLVLMIKSKYKFKEGWGMQLWVSTEQSKEGEFVAAIFEEKEVIDKRNNNEKVKVATAYKMYRTKDKTELKEELMKYLIKIEDAPSTE